MMKRYKLLVAYDGTRFHGMQRQIDNDVLTEQFRQFIWRNTLQPPKRPHYEEGPTSGCVSSSSSGKRKRCTVSIQECIEIALLELYNDFTTNTITSTDENNNDDENVTKDENNNNNHYNNNDKKDRRKRSKKQQQQKMMMISSELQPLKLTVDDICLRFAGRTDKGVHANGQVVAVHLPSYLPPTILALTKHQQQKRDTKQQQQQETSILQKTKLLRKAINSRLPVDISIQKIELLDDDVTSTTLFDPRRDSKCKRYSYTIKYLRRSTKQSTINDNDTTVNKIDEISSGGGCGPHIIRHALQDGPCLWVCPWPIDDTDLVQLCTKLQGYHDYTNFVHKDVRYKQSNVMMLTKVEFHILKEEILLDDDEKDDDYDQKNENNNGTIIIGQFILEAVGFRRTMVRNIVGYCIDVCRGYSPHSSKRQHQSDTTCTTTTTTTITTTDELWIPNETIASKIPAAPASGLCLEYVQY